MYILQTQTWISDVNHYHSGLYKKQVIFHLK